jgi:CheY-like chemotaxis protein
MSAPQLQGMRILVVEDEMMAAMMLETLLDDAGGIVVGPVSSVANALALIATKPIDGAILDVNLGGEFVYPVADALAERGTPFVFITGYGKTAIDVRRYAVPVVPKPYEDDGLVRIIAEAIARHRAQV